MKIITDGTTLRRVRSGSAYNHPALKNKIGEVGMPVIAVLGPIVAAIGSGAAAAGTAVAGAAATVGGAAAAAGTAAAGAAAAAGSAVAGAASVAGAAIGSTAVGSAASAAASTIVGAAASVGAGVTTVGSAATGLITTAGSAAATAIGSTATGAAALEAAAAVTSAVGAAGSTLAGTAVGTAVTSAASSAGALAASAVSTTVGFLGTEGVAAAIVGATAYTGSNIVTAFNNFDEADELISKAKSEFSAIMDELDAKKADTVSKLEKLNILKLAIYSEQITLAIDVFKKIIPSKQKSTGFLDDTDLDKLFTKAEIQKLEKATLSAKDLLNQLDQGVSLMQAASTGSLAFMAQFGIASTGTAISSLSGAAATNATLAALGGGSLAAGGGGMALGNAVLGGITVFPAAIVLSWNYAKNSERALTEAHEHYANTKKEIGKASYQISILRNGIDQRIGEIEGALVKLSSICSSNMLPRLYEAYNVNKDAHGNVDFTACSTADKNTIALCVHFVRELANLMRVKVFDDSGHPSDESEAALRHIATDSKLDGVA